MMQQQEPEQEKPTAPQQVPEQEQPTAPPQELPAADDQSEETPPAANGE